VPSRDDVPQTVGEALREDWKWLGVECQLCRRRARIKLADHPAAEKLGSIAARLRCSQCGDRSGASTMNFTLVMAWLREKPISFSGYRAMKISMN
jgi:hypothetical protein